MADHSLIPAASSALVTRAGGAGARRRGRHRIADRECADPATLASRAALRVPGRSDYRYTGRHRLVIPAGSTSWLGSAERALFNEDAEHLRRACALVVVATLAACGLLLFGMVAYRPALISGTALAMLWCWGHASQ